MSQTNKLIKPTVKRTLSLSMALLLAMSGFIGTMPPQEAHAVTTIVVNSVADTTVNDGTCTLREAIIAANTDTASGAAVGECAAGSGADTIGFNISGVADFTNGGQNGYTIKPNSQLPDITAQVTIDGYSQPGALANTAAAPDPLNGRLLVDIDGSNLGDVSGFVFSSGSDSSDIKGLVINNFGTTPGAHAITLGATSIKVQGNYIGTNYDGTSAAANGAGVGNISVTTSAGAQIGGLVADQRNLISGNHDFALAPGDGWIVEGNYIGVSSNGVSALGNSAPDGSGGITIDYSDGVVIGGTDPGAINVISGNLMYGVSPVDATNLTIQGNLIGTDYTGTQAIPNVFVGILAGGANTNIQIGGTTAAARNIVSGNGLIGILIAEGTTGHVEGNYIGVDTSGQLPIPNGEVGIELGVVNSFTLGGTTPGARNVISASGTANVVVTGTIGQANNNVIQGNYIGTDSTGAINQAISDENGGGVLIYGSANNNLIGGTTAGSANRIAGNNGYGVSVTSFLVPAFAVGATPAGNTIIGNEIFANNEDTSKSIATGLGIDLAQSSIQSQTPQFPYLPDTFGPDFGPTLNDPTDSDTGPNNYINSPTLNSITQSGTEATIKYNLDAAGSPTNQYRLEFFANDQADPSGYGEGQTFLGAVTTSNGSNLQASIVLPGGINLAGKSITATTTAIDSNMSTGFGSTSEFSLAQGATVVGGRETSLALSGTNVSLQVWLAMGMMITSAGLIKRRSLLTKRF